jgi:hypothetical protein
MRLGLTKPLPGVGIDWSHPLARGLVGCWQLGEGAGSAGNDGVTGAMPALGSTLNPFVWSVRDTGLVVDLTASSRTLQINKTPLLDVTDFMTLEVRFWTSTYSGIPFPFSKGISSGYAGFGMYVSSAGTLSMEVRHNSANQDLPCPTTGTLAVSTWQYCILTWARGVVSYYQNGAFLGTSTASGTTLKTDGAATAWIGSWNGTGQYLGGYVDFARVRNVALTSAEVAALASAPHGLFLPTRFAQATTLPAAARPRDPYLPRRYDPLPLL